MLSKASCSIARENAYAGSIAPLLFIYCYDHSFTAVRDNVWDLLRFIDDNTSAERKREIHLTRFRGIFFVLFITRCWFIDHFLFRSFFALLNQPISRPPVLLRFRYIDTKSKPVNVKKPDSHILVLETDSFVCWIDWWSLGGDGISKVN